MTVIARFRFDPEQADAFCWVDGTSVVELQFDTVEEVIEYCEEYADALIDVAALVNGQVIALSDMPEVDEEELHA
jgi:hypothetical protein